MEGTDEFTELWWPPLTIIIQITNKITIVFGDFVSSQINKAPQILGSRKESVPSKLECL